MAAPTLDSTAPTLAPELTARLAALVTTAGDRPTQPSYAPFTGALVGEVPTCEEADVELAWTRARTAQQAWKSTSVAQRARIFLRYHDLMLDRQAEVLDVVQAETGKARVNAFEELADVAATARYYANTAAKHLKPKRRVGALPGATLTTEHHHPKGVVGVISPWNYPLTLAVSDAIPALLAGNAVVIKPDAQTPFTALLALEILFEAGVPRDLVGIVTGAGRTLGTPMIDRVDYLMFTGSTQTGRIIAEQCGRRLIGFSAELGGKNPMVVCADADLEKTVEGAVRACYSNSGQLCISIERMYVEDAIYDRFVPAFTERVKRMELGAATDFSCEMGSLISQDQLDIVKGHVDDAVSKGATVLAGGKPRPDLGPLFYEPTILEGVTEDMEVMRDETFGPVVAVSRVASAEEAIERANDTVYGLNASVWTEDTGRGKAIATRIEAGTVNVNEGYAAAWASHDAPMGGVKDSGVGRRHGREGILKYTEAQTVAIQRFVPMGPPAGMSTERYTEVMTKALKAIRRMPFVK